MRHTRIRTSAVAATALLATLSLTACQSDDDGKKSGASAPATSAPADQQPSPAADGAKAPAAGKSKQPATPAANKPSTGSGGASGAKDTDGPGDPGSVTAACTGANSKVTVSKVQRPLNHLLLTVTNTGSKACNAYHAPLLRFDDAQAATRIMDESRPQAVVTLAPGQSAYASILLSSADGSGGNGRTAKNLTVHFAPRSGSGSTGAPAGLPLPADTYTDDSAGVSYWQSTMDAALVY
ncbi:DUF4232 domain-containing protein [Streptomyces sp. NBC_01142]|uniref:DUF4232 domain-containing protein n=1 Tax=Streptomyces sp. NBC_01142 TaxID=2975865 RepID=UPI0022519FB9|nr:DUF4232 domain-containing protein [Streptomyces sp. NBC_01142]MCX4818537.1 DUF4232 domain-containing protein [Streptomyces sp. NBC_01142]